MIEAPALDEWWAELRAAALVGTARRPAPLVPAIGVRAAFGPTGADRAVLDGAALAGIARAAGALPSRGVVPVAPAPDDPCPPAPIPAAQMLDLLLGQAPAVGAHRNDLLLHWYERCAAAGRRVPDDLLVAALSSVAAPSDARVGQREALREVLGERGKWLAGRNPRWRWAAEVVGEDESGPDPTDADAWARLPAAARVVALARLRATDPGAARSLIAATWSNDPAAARANHLAVLGTGLGPEDDDLLESALDDRAASVRQVAVQLLDARPDSARGGRMATRLASLVTVRDGQIAVELPDEPDAAGVRDGLGSAPNGRSARGWWLERIAAGAPLSLWTDATGADPVGVLAGVTDGDVLRGITVAAAARQDPAWCEALYARTRDPRLLAALDGATVERLAVGVLARPLDTPDLVGLIAALPAPWTDALAASVVAALRATSAPGGVVPLVGEILARRLPPSGVARIEHWLAELGDHPQLTPALRAVLQLRSFRRSITEAFA